MLVVLNENKSEMTVEEDIENLLEAGAGIDLADDDETTALMCAVKKARLSVVRFLLQKGACANLADAQGRTVLHHAVAIDYPDMVRTLLETDVNVSSLVLLTITSLKNRFNARPVEYKSAISGQCF